MHFPHIVKYVFQDNLTKLSVIKICEDESETYRIQALFVLKTLEVSTVCNISYWNIGFEFNHKKYSFV